MELMNFRLMIRNNDNNDYDINTYDDDLKLIK